MLKEYNKKRNFNNTKEPKGVKSNSKKQNKKLKFCVQFHKARKTHFDLRLEWNGVLISFAVPKGFPQNSSEKRLAVKVEDHPLDYINFEGVIPTGNYGAGTVEIFDKGYYTPEYNLDFGLKKGHLKFSLHGKKLNGEYSLIRMDEKNWLLIIHEENQKNNKKTAKNQEKTQKKLKKPIKRSKKTKISAQLATLTRTIPKGDYLFEIKYDGYRILSFIDNKIKLVTRNDKDYTSKFPSIAKGLAKISTPCILDGEIIALDENGRSDFNLLQNSIKNNTGNFCYAVFDILIFNDVDVRSEPLLKRKELLKNVVKNLPKNIIYSEYILDGKKAFAFAKENNLEGVIAKKINSPYSGKRNEDWLKIKCYMRQEFIIIGFTTTEKNKKLSAILVGYYNNDNLVFAGKVGTGFTDNQREELSKMFDKIKIKTLEIENLPKDKNITLLKPKLIAEIKFTEFTKDNILRQPSFVGLREDKNIKDVVLEGKKR